MPHSVQIYCNTRFNVELHQITIIWTRFSIFKCHLRCKCAAILDLMFELHLLETVTGYIVGIHCYLLTARFRSFTEFHMQRPSQPFWFMIDRFKKALSYKEQLIRRDL